MSNLTRMDLDEFTEWLRQYAGQRRIASIHLHHTWRPNRAQWRGLPTLEAIRRYHIEQRGFSDIAQHLTIDPDGGLWTGRPLAKSPASSLGIDPITGGKANGDALAGPFMIEMVGDFDDGQDVLIGDQENGVLQVLARLMLRFGFATAASAVVAHREMSDKSCPGSSLWSEATLKSNKAGAWQNILNKHFLASIDTAYAALDPNLFAPRADTPGVRSLLTNESAGQGDDEGEVPEDAAGFEIVESMRVSDAGRPEGAPREALDPRFAALNPYVVNTAHGLLYSEPTQWTLKSTGKFRTANRDISQIILPKLSAFIDAEAQRQKTDTPTVRLMCWAHGGLVSESDALTYAYGMRGWWSANHVYPLFFVWETGWMETLLGHKRAFDGERGALDWLLEKSLGPVGERLWRRMKQNAALCSARDWLTLAQRMGRDADEKMAGIAGGARVFVRELLAWLKAHHDGTKVEIHACGHSAGSIFHAHFLPMLLEEIAAQKKPNVSIATLQFLAPALRCDEFHERLLPHLGKGIQRFVQYTMDRKRELDDDVAFVYRKSLLYFVRNACERGEPGILGLQESIDDDRQLAPGKGGLFSSANAHFAELHYSKGDDAPKGAATAANTHGGFDNDPSTLSSVLSVVLGGPIHSPLVLWKAPKPIPASRNAGDDDDPPAAANVRPKRPSGSGGHQRVALCIGIDDYPAAPLRGCVNDAQAWDAALRKSGFDVRLMTNEQATFAAIERSIARLLSDAADGAQVVIQFAGHGTQIPDADGDEDDGNDEAYVPHDYQSAGFLIDDRLYSWLRPHQDRLQMSLIFDTCHSGSGSRFAPLSRPLHGGDERVRFLQVREDVLATHRRVHGSPRSSRSSQPKAMPGWLHYAACTDFEYAYETDGSGDFTRAFLAVFEEAVLHSWLPDQVMAAVRAQMRKPKRQSPRTDQARADVLQRSFLGGPHLSGSASAPSLRTQLMAIVQQLPE